MALQKEEMNSPMEVVLKAILIVKCSGEKIRESTNKISLHPLTSLNIKGLVFEKKKFISSKFKALVNVNFSYSIL